MSSLRDNPQPKGIPIGLLGRLLSALRVSVQEGKPRAAFTNLPEDNSSISHLNRLRFLFKELQLTDLRPAQLKWSRFDRKRLPALLYFEDQWFFVESSEDADTVLLTDESGQQRIDLIEQIPEGLVIWIQKQPSRSQSRSASDKKNASILVWQELFRNKRWLIDVGVATLVVNLLAIATSIFAMQTYDRVVPTLAYATLSTMVVGMLIIIGLDWILKMLRAHILDSVANGVDKRVSQKVFDHVMHLQLDLRPRSLGTLSAQITGLDSVRQFFSSTVIFSLIDVPFVFLFIFFIYIIGGSVAFVYIALLPIAVLLGWVTQSRLRRLLREQMIRSNERQGVIVVCLRGTETIRSSNANWRFSQLWEEITGSINDYNLKQKTISNFSMTTTGSLSTLAYVGAIVVGVSQIEDGNLTMGGLIACSILGGRVIGPVARAVQQLVQWQHVEQSLDMVNQVLAVKKERADDQHLVIPDQAPKQIKLDSVRFSYGESPLIQVDVPSLSIQSGERIALFGPVGSGKSTLLKMIAGLYRPKEGMIKLGDADLWEIDPNKLSEYVAYLPQNVSLFKGSLRSNLALSGAVSDSHLLEVSAKLGIDQIAAGSPQHMEMEISEGGEGLSEGQKQLVGLARVFLARPKVWLLDEPTSSMDLLSEQKVIDAIVSYLKPEDILIVSTHRPMIANKLANRILLLQQGKVVEDGKPEAILSKIMPARNRNLKNAVAGIPPNRPGGIDVI